MSKLTELLSDEESRQQIDELAKMLSSELNINEQNAGQPQSPLPDFAAISKLMSAFDKTSQQDKNLSLLIALREHLCPERQERVDRAIKLMRVLEIAKTAKESGLLENLI